MQRLRDKKPRDRIVKVKRGEGRATDPLVANTIPRGGLSSSWTKSKIFARDYRGKALYIDFMINQRGLAADRRLSFSVRHILPGSLIRNSTSWRLSLRQYGFARKEGEWVGGGSGDCNNSWAQLGAPAALWEISLITLLTRLNAFC